MQEINNFSFRKAVLSDLPSIIPVIEDAKATLKENGVDQWQEGFPNSETLTNDILNRYSYVIFSKEDSINPAGFIVLSLEREEPYHNPLEGSLKLEGPYVTIHTTAVSKICKGKGISKAMFAFAEDFARLNNRTIIRIDTHKDNKIMQHILDREKFQYCCLVQLPPEENLRMRRLVFEKAIQ